MDNVTKSRKLHPVLKIFKILWLIVKGILITYAVIFSIGTTIAAIYAVNYAMKPIKDVRYLIKHNPEKTAYMAQYCSELKTQGKTGELYHTFMPFDSISKNLKNAVIAAEDDGFYIHPGFDIEAIMKAYEYNKGRGKIKRGASTITQQLAKNLFLSDERSFTRKAKELGYTILLERYLTKDRIFELYLNYAQWGDTIFGCEAASKHFFKKSSSKLTLYESTRLAATLVSPSKLHPLNTRSTFVQRRVEAIAMNLYKHHVVDDSAYVAVFGLKLPGDTLTDSLSDTLSEADSL